MLLTEITTQSSHAAPLTNRKRFCFSPIRTSSTQTRHSSVESGSALDPGGQQGNCRSSPQVDSTPTAGAAAAGVLWWDHGPATWCRPTHEMYRPLVPTTAPPAGHLWYRPARHLLDPWTGNGRTWNLYLCAVRPNRSTETAKRPSNTIKISRKYPVKIFLKNIDHCHLFTKSQSRTFRLYSSVPVKPLSTETRRPSEITRFTGTVGQRGW